MTTRYELDYSSGRPVSTCNGEPLPPDVKVATVDHASMPSFVGIYVNDERTYDVEIWIVGQMKWSVPPKSPDVEALYDQLEAARSSK